MGEWISVKERVPKLDTPVIISTKCGNVFEAVRIRKNGRTYWTNSVWKWSPNMCEHTGPITHWMPFPEPPNELKPCPFCGGAVRLNKINHRTLNCRNYWFLCHNCDAYIMLTAKSKYKSITETEKEAAELWNRRVEK